MKKLNIWAIFTLALIATGCSKSFTIKGNMFGLNSGRLQLVTLTDEGARQSVADAEGNRFEIKGVSPYPTLVLLYDGMQRMVAHFVMENGDDMQMRGDVGDIYGIEVKGSDINERWYAFVAEHKALYIKADRKELDTAIEKYVAENPNDMLSALLLMVDYGQLGNEKKTDSLLKSLSDEAKPEWLLRSYSALKAHTASKSPRLSVMQLHGTKPEIETLNVASASATLLYCWTYTTSHLKEVEPLKALSATCGKRLQIADLYFEPDTAAWRSHLDADHTEWAHLWVPDGPASEYLKAFSITSTPFYLVADSTGAVKYQGTDVAAAQQQVKAIIK